MTDLSSKHSYKLAVARGELPYVPPERPNPPIPSASEERRMEQLHSSDGRSKAQFVAPHVPSFSTLISIDDDVFSTGSDPSTKTSGASSASAFAQGWKAAMQQTQSERPLACSDIDRFALDLTETLDGQLAGGKRLTAGLKPRKPDENEVELFYPALFKSICICDMSIMGNPLALHSRHFRLSPRGLRVGEAQFLNLPRRSRHTCHLSARRESNGQTQYILEYSNVLVSAGGDKATYLLATQMDVSTSIMSIAEVLNARFWINGSNKHGNDKLRAEEPAFHSPTAQDIDWCQLARERPESSHAAYKDLRAAKDELILRDANVLEFWEMIEDIRYFHSQYFTLMMGREATGPVWSINYLSPSLATSIEDVKASFSHTDRTIMLELGTALAGKGAKSFVIRWGVNAEPRRLYCSPMFRQVQTCWLCFLTREDIGDLWDQKFSTTPSP